MARAGRHGQLERVLGMASALVGLAGDLPHEAGELTGDGDRDGAAFLAAGAVEVRSAAVQPLLRAPRGIDRGRDWPA